MSTKRCTRCLCEKPLDAFYAHAQKKDGRLSKCKECTKADNKRNRLDKLEYYRAYDRVRASSPHRMAKNREISERWRHDYPGRKKAQAKLRYAVLSGRVKPWPVCAIPECNSERPVAHHPNYAEPLDVVWLCQAHHKQAHALTDLKAA